MIFRQSPVHGLASVLLILSVVGGSGVATAAELPRGEQVYQQICMGCHQIGVLGAPKSGDTAAWTERFRKGLDALVQNASNGVGKMPPKGGNPNLSADDLRSAIQFMAGAQVVASAAQPESARNSVKPAPAEGMPAAMAARGAEVVAQVCRGCHAIGVLNAPKIGNVQDWSARLKKGEDALVQSALKGTGNMPPKGGNSDLTAEDLRAAIRYMADPDSTPQTAAAKPAPAKPAAGSVQPTAQRSPANANRFNRLMRPAAQRNPPPAEDGIHDPDNDGTLVLQPPRLAFESLPKSGAGNHVDWSKALAEAAIEPRWDLTDPSKKPLTMDLNIVREVKGSMPNVVYPHKQHLEWLDCSNCHPGIFEPRKGANQISMAEILLGRKCGVCHGKVAFPVSECRRCHSQKKSTVTNR